MIVLMGSGGPSPFGQNDWVSGLGPWQARVSKHALCFETHAGLYPAASQIARKVPVVPKSDLCVWSGLWRYECENKQHSTLMPSSVLEPRVKAAKVSRILNS